MARDFFDDLVGTLSDADEISDDEEEVRGEEEQQQSALRKVASKKRKRNDDGEEKGVVKKQREGDKDEDLESDFEFETEGRAAGFEELDAWAVNGEDGEGRSAVGDIDAIVARRKGKGKMEVDESEEEEDSEGEEHSEADDDDDDDDVDNDDGEEFHTAFEGLNGDGDGESEDEGSQGAGEEDEDQDQDDNDDEVAVHVPHPDDVAGESASDDEADDAVEREKRNAFFANDEGEGKQATSATTAFNTLNLSRPILKGLAAVGFSKPTPIQAKSIPVALEGKDLVGGAVTGSGKTGAFLIPILERLLYRPTRTPTTRVAILMPTRELALQCFSVAKKLASFTDITFGQAIGGMSSKEQEKQLKQRPDIVIATPGRFIDLERNSSAFAVHTIEILVLDEADRMLEEGFADELNEILSKIPKSRQTMLFSATMTSKVDDLIRVGLQRPIRLMVNAQKQTVSGLVQEFVRLRPGREKKRLGYLLHLCERVYMDRVIIFFRQKKEAHRVRVIFALCGMKAAELHGSMSQEQRINAIESFRTGKASFLLATDLASRGLDIKGIETVINYEAPQTHEIYLHRVGRTARAGRSGRACTLAAEPDRKVVKAAVKTGKAQGAQIRQRTIEAADVDAWHTRLEAMQDEIEEVLREEKEERAMQQVDRDLTRADNIVKYEDEIKSRPKKTWFENEKDKLNAKEKGRVALNGEGEGKKEKKKGKLSNKDKKRLQDKDDRRSGMEWKKSKSATLKGNAKASKGKLKAKGKGKK